MDGSLGMLLGWVEPVTTRSEYSNTVYACYYVNKAYGWVERHGNHLHDCIN